MSSEIINDGWQKHLGHDWLPEVTPAEAGANLGHIASAHTLTLFAHYNTDTAGHRGGMEGAIDALERVDHFLEGLVETLSSEVLLLVASDHGNIEDIRGGHTRNPALGIASGPGSAEALGLSDLREVAPFILKRLGITT